MERRDDDGGGSARGAGRRGRRRRGARGPEARATDEPRAADERRGPDERPPARTPAARSRTSSSTRDAPPRDASRRGATPRDAAPRAGARATPHAQRPGPTPRPTPTARTDGERLEGGRKTAARRPEHRGPASPTAHDRAADAPHRGSGRARVERATGGRSDAGVEAGDGPSPDARARLRPRAARREPEAEAREVAPEIDHGPALDPAPGAITEWKGYTLNPFQVEAVAAIRGGHNVLVSAPTGAGKTLVAEYAIEDAVARGRRCIYTSPIKALSNQKYRDFRDDPKIDVGLLTGDVTIHPSGQVLIMTTEILRNAIFDNPEYLHDVEYVVFDEVHYMDDVERGSVWEESLIFAPENIRFICLSATISNVEELGAWLREIRGPDIVVIHSSRRPVPLHHRLYTARSGAFELEDVDRVRKRETDAHERTGRKRRGRGGRRGSGRGDEWGEVPRPGPLLDQLHEQKLLPVLVFAFSRKDCERLAYANAGRELLSVPERERMEALQEELLRLFQLDRGELHGELLAMARRGIGYHHAGMLPIHKELVERMFTSGLLKMLFTTETFALGINMPARTVVFHSLRKFDGVTFDYVHTRDYLQMAGRAGRQGIDREGLVYSLLSPRDLAEAPVKRILSGRPEPVESRFRLSFASILHLVERLGRARVHEAWEKSFNQFQHRGGTKKQQEANRREQRRVLEGHLALLDELGYLSGDDLTPRGRVAKLINGYELQVTELLFGGQIENLSPSELGIVFVGLVYEERRRGETVHVPARFYGNVRSAVTREIHHLRMRAGEHHLMTSVKAPDWGLTEAASAWIDGASFEEVEELCDATPGDVVRNLRMAVQLMRQVRRAIDPDWDLRDRLAEAMETIHRDVVDARRQLELG